MAWPENVRKTDLRIDYYRGSGKGGQNRNKRDTACRITHIPTGEVATAEEHKTQGQNRKAAFKRLSAKLVPMMVAALKPKDGPERFQKTEVRVYKQPRHTVKDKRLPDATFRYEDVLDGSLDAIHRALIGKGED